LDCKATQETVVDTTPQTSLSLVPDALSVPKYPEFGLAQGSAGYLLSDILNLPLLGYKKKLKLN